MKDLKFHFSDDVIPEWLSNNEAVISQINKQVIFEEVYPFQTERKIQCKSYKLPILDGKNIIGLLNIAFDITDELKDKAAYQNEKDTLEVTLNTILTHIPGHVYWYDKQGYLLGCNEKQAISLGHNTAAEVKGKHLSELLPKKEAEEALNVLNRIVTTGQIEILEESITFIQGNLELLSYKVPLKNNQGGISGLLGLSVDISKQKDLERKLFKEKEITEAANKSKTEFLENMRHDIRTPLIGIMGFAEIIKSEASNPKIKEYADNLVSSSHSLLDLLNEVLEAIKVNSGDIPILRKKFNLQKKLNDIILLNQAKASEKKDVELSFHYDSNIPRCLIGDGTRIHRVVLELVTNALNFTHKGYVKLSAQLAKDNADDVVIKIIVDDTGVGILAEKQQEIYLQFKRLTPSYEGIYKGQGLGLFIVNQFVNDLQGEIDVKSDLGLGSKFIFIVKVKKCLLDEELDDEAILAADDVYKIQPRKALKTSEVSVASNSKDETGTTYKSLILVVEDSPMAALVVIDMLSSLDCEVDVAEKGKLAVQMAEEKPYDLIFMDIGLPDIDGYETTKRIRLNELRKRHVPIIALTAHAGEDNKKHCIDIGMNAVLSKPLGKEKAEDMLNSFIPYRKEKLNRAKNSEGTS